jgi:FSR family fosmidomycin resistance protein-like MFS transporter
MPDNNFQKKRIWTISAAHFFHDIYPAFFAPVLPLLISKFGLSLAAAGSLDIARKLPSLMTPLIGYIADRKPVKYFIIATPAVTAASMSLLGTAENYPIAVILLFFAGLSTNCFHVPAPVIVKYFAGHKVKKGMSYFMSAGAIAGTVGTFTITMTIAYLGFEKSWILMFPGILISIILFFRFRDISKLHPNTLVQTKNKLHSTKSFIPFFIILIIVMFFRAAMTLAFTLYLPVYLIQKGTSLQLAGLSLSLLHLSGAAGMIITGKFSDKVSSAKMISVLLILSAASMWTFTNMTENFFFSSILLVIQGFVMFSISPLLLALVQHLKSKRPAFVNSIYFTLGFIVNTIGVILLGICGDLFGLQNTFEICSILPLLSIPFVFLLSKSKHSK